MISPRRAEGWRTVRSSMGGTHYTEQVPKSSGAVQPFSLMGRSSLKTAKCVIFATSIPATTWSVTGKIILTALFPYSLIIAHPARMRGGRSEAMLGGCAFFMVMSYDVLICQIKYMSQHFHLYLLHACKINSHINHTLPFSLGIGKQFAKVGWASLAALLRGCSERS